MSKKLSAIQIAEQKLGSASAVAKIANVSPQAIHIAKKRGSGLPIKHLTPKQWSDLLKEPIEILFPQYFN